ncbi:hypothetical protein AMECASPLE_037958 [Ameca splendens]|uniref:Secreted protein n=1 Tax=Ameca splendens TaxID=208324 RepID=A0ABV0YV60_9TELE
MSLFFKHILISVPLLRLHCLYSYISKKESGIKLIFQNLSQMVKYRYLCLGYTALLPPVPEHTPTRLPLSGWFHCCSKMIPVRGAQCNFSGNEGGRSTCSKLLFWLCA